MGGKSRGHMKVGNFESVGAINEPKSKRAPKGMNPKVDLTAFELLDQFNVYLLYFDRGFGVDKYTELKKQLSSWGEATGNNLLVGFWNQSDPRYAEVIDLFKITKTPAIVMTGKKGYATIKCDGAEGQGAWRSAFLTINDERLLSNDEELTTCLDRVYNLLLANKVEEALVQTKKETDQARIIATIKMIADRLGPIGKFLDEHNIKVGIAGFNMEVTLAKKGG